MVAAILLAGLLARAVANYFAFRFFKSVVPLFNYYIATPPGISSQPNPGGEPCILHYTWYTRLGWSLLLARLLARWLIIVLR